MSLTRSAGDGSPVGFAVIGPSNPGIYAGISRRRDLLDADVVALQGGNFVATGKDTAEDGSGRRVRPGPRAL